MTATSVTVWRRYRTGVVHHELTRPAALIVAFVVLGASAGFLAALLGPGSGMLMVLLTTVFGGQGFMTEHVVHTATVFWRAGAR